MKRQSGKRRSGRNEIRFANILFATDFTRYSGAALPYLRSLVGKYRSKVFIVHVVGPAPAEGEASGRRRREGSATQRMREARRAMAALAAEWKGVRHQSQVRRGDIWREIAKVIREKKIDLVVTGTRGRRGVSKALLGSVAERIFRQAPCPVLTVGPNISGEPESIVDLQSVLFPTDFSEASLAALPYAISLAQENRAHLYLLHVMAGAEDGPVGASLEERLRTLVPREANLWCEPKAFVESGHPAEVILNQAEELGVDLIVLGTRSRATMAPGKPLPMATAYRVVREALCPVLTVHARARRVRSTSAVR